MNRWMDIYWCPELWDLKEVYTEGVHDGNNVHFNECRMYHGNRV